MMSEDMFRRRAFSGLILATALVAFSGFSVMLIVPYFLARLTGLPWALAGLVLACSPIGQTVASGLAGRLIEAWSARVAAMTAMLQRDIDRGRTTPGPDQANDVPIAMLKQAGRKAAGVGLIGSPDTIRRQLLEFEAAHIDQVILLNQAGDTSHRAICDSLELFAREVMPEFQAREARHLEWKAAVLAGELALEEIDTSPYMRRAIADPGQKDQALLG